MKNIREPSHFTQREERKLNVDIACIRSRRIQLRLIGPWPTGKWLGPVLRGLIAAPIKRYSCVWDSQTREQLYEYCNGCSHQSECQYARWFEPVSLEDGIDGSRHALNEVCIIPDFQPGQSSYRPTSDVLSVEMRFINSTAGMVDQFVERLKSIALRPTPGRQGLSFQIVNDHQSSLQNECFDFWDSWNLIQSIPITEMVENVALHAVTPLILKRGGQEMHRPELIDIVSASLRLLRRVIRQTVSSTPDREDPTASDLTPSDIRAWTQTAIDIGASQTHWRNVLTAHHSFRRHRTDPINACHGFNQYERLPLRLARMIELAGHLGIGQRRVFGAGQVIVKPVSSE